MPARYGFSCVTSVISSTLLTLLVLPVLSGCSVRAACGGIGRSQRGIAQMTERKHHWEDVHSRKREDEVSWFQARPETSLALIAEGMDASASVIDIGAGASRLVDALLAQGYRDVTVLDIASTAFERVQERLGAQADEVTWEVADITQWQPERHYDVWHDRAVFHFLVDAADREAYRRAVLNGTHPGSRVIIGTFAEDGPEKCSGLPVRRYSAEELAAELGQEFVLEKTLREAHSTPGGNIQNFRFCTFRRV